MILVICVALSALLQGCGSTSTLPPRPQTLPSPPTPSPDAADIQALYQRLSSEWGVISFETTVILTPITTKEVAGKKIAIPSDARVFAWLSEAGCFSQSPCPVAPIYGIKRSNSIISVEAQTGRILTETLAPGEEGAFNFLKE